MSRIVIAAIIASTAIAGGVRAQTVMDGSDVNIPKADMSASKKALQSFLSDPYGSQLADLKRSTNGVCGKVNAKNKMGGYVGFRTFAVDLKNNRIVIEPREPDTPDHPEMLSTRRLEKLKAEIEIYITTMKNIVAICKDR